MARRTRRQAESGIHHVMNRGVNRGLAFFGDADRVEFGRGLADLHDRFGVETIAYCLMGNHYHLVLRVPDDQLSAAMHHLGTAYTVRTNLRVGRDGPIFRGRFHSIPIETDAYFTWAARYVHRNALDLPGIHDPADYRWSSYRTYLGVRRPAEFLNTEPLLAMFDGDRDRLRHFTETSASIGFSGSTSIRDLLQLLDFEIGRDDLAVGNDGAGAPWRARAVLVLLGDRLAAHPIATAIESHLAFPSLESRRRAVRRARLRSQQDPTIARVADRVAGHFAVPRPEGVGPSPAA